MVCDIVVVCVNDKMLVHILLWKDIDAICYNVKYLTVHHSCSGGFLKTILEETWQVFWTVFTLLPSHMGPQPCTPTQCLHSHILVVIE